METVLAKQLSGTEVIAAILYDLRTLLEHDDRLAPHLAFNAASYTVTVAIRLPSSAQPNVERTLTYGRGSAADIEALPDAPTVELTITRPEQPPNELRLDTEQPLTVLTRESDGRTTERQVSYAGRSAEGKSKLPAQPGQPQPRNTVVGGES